MKIVRKYRLRKCTDVNMDLPFFEVLDEEGKIIMDVSKTDEGECLVFFHEGCLSKAISAELLGKIVSEAKELIEKEAD